MDKKLSVEIIAKFDQQLAGEEKREARRRHFCACKRAISD